MSKYINSKNPYLLIDFAKRQQTQPQNLRYRLLLGGGIIFAVFLLIVLARNNANTDAQKIPGSQVSSIPLAMPITPEVTMTEIAIPEVSLPEVSTQTVTAAPATTTLLPVIPTLTQTATTPIQTEATPAPTPATPTPTPAAPVQTAAPAINVVQAVVTPPALSKPTQVAALEKITPKKPIVPTWKTVAVQSGDTMSTILSRESIPTNEIAAILSTPNVKGQVNHLKPGQKVRILMNPNQRKLEKMTIPISDTTNLNISKTKEGYTADLEHYPIEKRLAYSEGTISNSLFIDGQRAGLSDSLIMELSKMFGWDIDFALDLRNTDTFRVLYEENFRDGEKMQTSNIVAAEFVNNGRSFQAIRYIDANGDAGYYTPDGLSLKKAFLRTPVKFSRISSRFTLQRNHPILHRIRAHRGVDYAAPRGTPVKAAGSGQIIFAGVRNGFGNVVEILHGSRYSTLYGHLDKIGNGIHNGGKIRQGETIGYVGSTGLATGPHLHYEFRIDGAHHDPLTVRLPHSEPITADSRDAFMAYSNQIIAKMNLFQKEYAAAKRHTKMAASN